MESVGSAGRIAEGSPEDGTEDGSEDGSDDGSRDSSSEDSSNHGGVLKSKAGKPPRCRFLRKPLASSFASYWCSTRTLA